jgi:hypothetical protein
LAGGLACSSAVTAAAAAASAVSKRTASPPAIESAANRAKGWFGLNEGKERSKKDDGGGNRERQQAGRHRVGRGRPFKCVSLALRFVL